VKRENELSERLQATITALKAIWPVDRAGTRMPLERTEVQPPPGPLPERSTKVPSARARYSAARLVRATVAQPRGGMATGFPFCVVAAIGNRSTTSTVGR
jgi:hypothetical protein